MKIDGKRLRSLWLFLWEEERKKNIESKSKGKKRGIKKNRKYLNECGYDDAVHDSGSHL